MIIYGIGAQGLADQIGCSPEEAQGFMDKYLDSKPSVEQFIKNTQQFGVDNGYIEIMSGFKRYLFQMYSPSKVDKSSALRKTVNTMVQGSGAFLTNTSLIYIQDYLEKNHLKSELALTVHDSIFGDVHPGEEQVLDKVQHIMTHLPLDWLYTVVDGEKVRYPIDVEMSIGNSYHDLIDYDPKEFVTFKSATGYIDYFTELSQLNKMLESKLLEQKDYDRKVAYLKEHKNKYQGLLVGQSIDTMV